MQYNVPASGKILHNTVLKRSNSRNRALFGEKQYKSPGRGAFTDDTTILCGERALKYSRRKVDVGEIVVLKSKVCNSS